MAQTADLLLRQALEAHVPLALCPDLVFVLAVEEAEGSQGETDQLEGEVDGMAYVKLWRVRREIGPAIIQGVGSATGARRGRRVAKGEGYTYVERTPPMLPIETM